MDLKSKVLALRNRTKSSTGNRASTDSAASLGSSSSSTSHSLTQLLHGSITSISQRTRVSRDQFVRLPHVLLLYLSHSYLDDRSTCALGRTSQHILLSLIVDYQRRVLWPIELPSNPNRRQSNQLKQHQEKWYQGDYSIGRITRIHVTRKVEALRQYQISFPLVFTGIKELRLSPPLTDACIFPVHLQTLIYDQQPKVVSYHKRVHFPITLTHLRFERINAMEFFLPLRTIPRKLVRLEVTLSLTHRSPYRSYEAQKTHIFNQLHAWCLKHDLSTCEILITPAPPSSTQLTLAALRSRPPRHPYLHRCCHPACIWVGQQHECCVCKPGPWSTK